MKVVLSPLQEIIKFYLKLNLVEEKNGFIYLKGTPVFDKEHQLIYFKNVSFDLKTKNYLLKSSSWILSPSICKYIETASILDLKKRVF